MSSKKNHLYNQNKSIPQSKNVDKPLYKHFVCCCIILIAGIYVPLQFNVYYLEYTFLYLIVVPVCFIAGLYFKYIKKLKKGLLYISLWAVFCTTFSSYTIANLIYTNTQDTHTFQSEVEDTAPNGYRSPANIFFKLDNKMVALVVNNEYPVKERLKQGQSVMISGLYRKGLLSSVMITDYTTF